MYQANTNYASPKRHIPGALDDYQAALASSQNYLAASPLILLTQDPSLNPTVNAYKQKELSDLLPPMTIIDYFDDDPKPDVYLELRVGSSYEIGFNSSECNNLDSNTLPIMDPYLMVDVSNDCYFGPTSNDCNRNG